VVKARPRKGHDAEAGLAANHVPVAHLGVGGDRGLGGWATGHTVLGKLHLKNGRHGRREKEKNVRSITKIRVVSRKLYDEVSSVPLLIN
jgi:hypothetical protein